MPAVPPERGTPNLNQMTQDPVLVSPFLVHSALLQLIFFILHPHPALGMAEACVLGRGPRDPMAFIGQQMFLSPGPVGMGCLVWDSNLGCSHVRCKARSRFWAMETLPALAWSGLWRLCLSSTHSVAQGSQMTPPQDSLLNSGHLLECLYLLL